MLLRIGNATAGWVDVMKIKEMTLGPVVTVGWWLDR
jgi:hypothetical protein